MTMKKPEGHDVQPRYKCPRAIHIHPVPDRLGDIFSISIHEDYN